MSVYPFLPETLQHPTVKVGGPFVGEGWRLTPGALFMLIGTPGRTAWRKASTGGRGGFASPPVVATRRARAPREPSRGVAMAILTVRSINKRFAGLMAPGEVKLEVATSAVHAAIGPNGAGRSTLLSCLVDDTGTVYCDGVSLLGIEPQGMLAVLSRCEKPLWIQRASEGASDR